MDVTQALKDTENSLRDFIAAVLHRRLGSDWVEKCGVSEERIEAWKKRKLSEEGRQKSGVVEERLILVLSKFVFCKQSEPGIKHQHRLGLCTVEDSPLWQNGSNGQ